MQTEKLADMYARVEAERNQLKAERDALEREAKELRDTINRMQGSHRSTDSNIVSVRFLEEDWDKIRDFALSSATTGEER